MRYKTKKKKNDKGSFFHSTIIRGATATLFQQVVVVNENKLGHISLSGSSITKYA
jgi:hypothetical protein